MVTGTLVLAIYQGWAGAVMVSGESMLPVLKDGDIVVFTKAADYEVGDIAVFDIPEGVGAGQSVIHRIVGGSAEQGWSLQGDNRDMQDPWLVPDSRITGTPRFVIPGGTKWLRFAADRSPFIIAGLVTLTVAVATFPSRDNKDTKGRRREGDPACSGAADGDEPVDAQAAADDNSVR